jgi:hypothetical protein
LPDVFILPLARQCQIMLDLGDLPGAALARPWRCAGKVKPVKRTLGAEALPVRKGKEHHGRSVRAQEHR